MFPSAVAKSSFYSASPRRGNTGRSPEIWLVGADEFTPLEGDVEHDMLTRDVTVNAAAFDAQGRLFCHPDFLADMAARRLRFASPDALKNDPLRLFRVARFAAAWPDWTVPPETLDAMRRAAVECRSAVARASCRARGTRISARAGSAEAVALLHGAARRGLSFSVV